jgi:hypothetical protein
MVVPVGQMFDLLKKNVHLYDKDGSHSNFVGSFVAACVFFQTIFGKPNKLECDKIDAKTLDLISKSLDESLIPNLGKSSSSVGKKGEKGI